MKRMRWIGACAAAACVAFPAAASAQPNVADVAQKVRGAEAAFELARQAAEQGNPEELVSGLQAQQALARSAARRASRVKGAANAARAEQKVAAHHDRSFNAFAEIVGLVPPQVQPIVVEALARSSASRDEVAASLTELADRLPAKARAAVLAAVTRMQTDGDLESIVAAIGGGGVSADVRAELGELLGTITARLDDAMARLEGLVGQLPPQAQGPVAAAIERLNGHLTEVAGILEGVLGSLPVGAGSQPEGSICEALGGFGIPLPICR